MIASPPPSIVYTPNFITSDEETRLFEAAATSKKWITLRSGRCLQQWGAALPSSATSENPNSLSTALPQQLPHWLRPLAQRLETIKASVADSAVNCLVNKYEPGQGIHPHGDGPAFRSHIATVSLGEITVLNLYRKRNLDHENLADSQQTPDFRVVLEPRSLVIISGEMYDDYLHGIDEVKEDVVFPEAILNWNQTEFAERLATNEPVILPRTSDRISLTFRLAAKVSKLKLFGKVR